MREPEAYEIKPETMEELRASLRGRAIDSLEALMPKKSNKTKKKKQPEVQAVEVQDVSTSSEDKPKEEESREVTLTLGEFGQLTFFADEVLFGMKGKLVLLGFKPGFRGSLFTPKPLGAAPPSEMHINLGGRTCTFDKVWFLDEVVMPDEERWQLYLIVNEVVKDLKIGEGQEDGSE